MLKTALDAKANLEEAGLHVSFSDTQSLWIAGNLSEMGNGIKVSNDACILTGTGGRWTAGFPAEGMCIYEVGGTLTELVSLITSVYTHYRQAGCQFKDAFKLVMADPDQYLVGRTMARV